MAMHHRLRRKARVWGHELRWRTGLLPKWVHLPPPPSGCRLFPDGRYLLPDEEIERAARFVRAEHPSVAENIVREAERTANGRPHLWGRQVEGAVTWESGLLEHGWPVEPFWRLNLEGEGTLGDVKLAWEPSRHVQFLTLARAYTLTRDSRFSSAWSEQLLSWIGLNPPWMGVHWASPLELSFRVITWCWSAAHFRDSAELDAEFWAVLTAALAAHLHHLDSHLTPPQSVASNHRLGEGAALVLGSIALPTHPRARRWYRKGMRTFMNSLRRGLSGEILWGESSSSYHFFALELSVLVWAALRAHRRTVPRRLPAFVAALREGAELLTPSSGSFLRWGDDDDYRLADPLQGPEERGLWAVEAVCRMMGEPLPCWCSHWHPVLPWVLGSDLPSLPRRRAVSGMRAEREFARCDTAGTSLYLFGPLKGHCRAAPGHAHADLLGVCLFDRHGPIVMDPGTYTYGGDPHWRAFFRTTGAHSTVVVDGMSQMDPAGRFGWRGDGPGAWDEPSEAFGLYLTGARHEAYQRLGVAHHRLVLIGPEGTIILRDELEGIGRHMLSQRFLLPADAAVTEEDGATSLVVVRREESVFAIKASAPPGWELRVGEEGGWYSPGYGLKRPAALALRDLETQLPATMEVIIEPNGRTIRTVKGGALLTTCGGYEILAIPEGESRGLSVTLPPPLGFVRYDAAAVQLKVNDQGLPLEARLIRGRSLELAAGTLLESSSRLEGIYLRWEKDGVRVASLEPWAGLSVGLEPGKLAPAGSPCPLGGYFAAAVVSP